MDLTYPHPRLLSKAVGSPGSALLGVEIVYPGDDIDIKPQLGHAGNATRR